MEAPRAVQPRGGLGDRCHGGPKCLGPMGRRVYGVRRWPGETYQEWSDSNVEHLAG